MRSPFDAVAWRVMAWSAVCCARRNTRQALARSKISHVLVVCYGNIYRSAFAGAYLKQQHSPTVTVMSGGFHARAGRPVPDRHVAMALKRGVDLSVHRSSVIEPAHLDWADIVVIMDRKNWVRLCRMEIDRSKLVWLGTCAPGAVEIPDPDEMDDAGAALVIDRLLLCCRGLVANLGWTRPA